MARTVARVLLALAAAALVVAIGVGIGLAVINLLPSQQVAVASPSPTPAATATPPATPSPSAGPGNLISIMPQGDCTACHKTPGNAVNVPPIGHPLEGWGSCTSCHANDRLVETAPGHSGIHADQCLVCHTATTPGGRGSPSLPGRELEVPLVPRLAGPAARQHEGPLRGHLLPLPPGNVASRAGLPASGPGRRHVPHLPRRREGGGAPRGPRHAHRQAVHGVPPGVARSAAGGAARPQGVRGHVRVLPRQGRPAGLTRRLRSSRARRAPGRARDGPLVPRATGHRDPGRRRMALRCTPRRRRIVVHALRASMSDALRHGTRSR